jgi:soluble lytic murein transglycosylase-like protein
MFLLAFCGCAPGPVDGEPVTPEEPKHSGHAAAVDEPDPAPGASEAGHSKPADLPAAVGAWWPEISVTAERHHLPPALVALVIWLESNGDAAARSPSGALGLMQLMPATAAKVAAARGEPAPTEAELLDPSRNLELGCAHLSALATELGTSPLDGAAVHRIAIAYNGGTKVLTAWQGGAPLPDETDRYATKLRERWEALAPPE